MLRALRGIKGLSRTDLEVSSRRPYSQLRGLELGDRWPSDKMLTSIGPALGFPPSGLVTGRDEFLAAVEQARPEVAVLDWLAALAPVVDSQFVVITVVQIGEGQGQRADRV